MASKKDKTVVEVKEVYTDVFGYNGGEMEYSPIVFDSLNVHESQRFTVTIKPLSDADCVAIRTINAKLYADLALFNSSLSDEAKRVEKEVQSKIANLKKGQQAEDVITDDEANVYLALQKQRGALDNISEKFKIVFPYISGFDGLTAEKWASMHNKIREDIYNKIIEISNVSLGETINLS